VSCSESPVSRGGDLDSADEGSVAELLERERTSASVALAEGETAL